MKKWMFALVIALPLLFAGTAKAEDNLKELMQQTGVAFNAVQKAILVNNDLGEETRTLCHRLEELAFRTIAVDIDVDKLTTDPTEKKRLLALFRKLASELSALSNNLEINVIEKNMNNAKTTLVAISDKRKEAHAIFKK